MCIPKSGSCGVAEGDRVKDGVCNAVFVRWISHILLYEHSSTLEHIISIHLGHFLTLKRCPVFRGSFVNFSMYVLGQ